MQHAGYLFLDREWEKDKQTIKNISGYYKSCQAPISVRILKYNLIYSIFKRNTLFIGLFLFIE
jgi:hypothetical protein